LTPGATSVLRGESSGKVAVNLVDGAIRSRDSGLAHAYVNLEIALPRQAS
jgi:hypothetical protein